jgi:hypothetical protein
MASSVTPSAAEAIASALGSVGLVRVLNISTVPVVFAIGDDNGGIHDGGGRCRNGVIIIWDESESEGAPPLPPCLCFPRHLLPAAKSSSSGMLNSDRTRRSGFVIAVTRPPRGVFGDCLPLADRGECGCGGARGLGRRPDRAPTATGASSANHTCTRILPAGCSFRSMMGSHSWMPVDGMSLMGMDSVPR